MTKPGGFLLDTNVLSETRKKKPDPGVVDFLESAGDNELYLSVLTLGEFRKGVLAKRREDKDAGARLSVWVDGLEESFADRILKINLTIARLWGDWSSERPRPVIDTLLAATASVHGLALVTRNVRHVADLQVKILNPWREPA